jgi:putative phosphoesterase
MRILVVSDIHANAHALRAITEPHDLCLCLGDLVDYGLDPSFCVRWAMKHVHHAVRGNHDHGVAQGVTVLGDLGYRYLTRVTRPLQWRSLDAEERRYLLQLPLTKRLSLDGKNYLLVHATPRDPLDEYLLKDPETWTRRVQHAEADIVLVGHSHMQFNLLAGNTVVLNPGSVGQPRDGDPRAAYALIDNGRIHLKRVEYDVEAAIAEILHAPIPDRARSLLAHALQHGRLPDEEPTPEEDAD